MLKTMVDHGKYGLNAKGLDNKLRQDALRVCKCIKNNSKILKRQDGGPGTRFFLR